jgi:N-acetylneuraminic acid mutarotase
MTTLRGYLAALLAFGTVVTTVSARQLSFEERVNAQEAIERVYYSHQIGATRPFEEAVPRALLERKVETYLAESLALERFWSTPISVAMLDREMERQARNSRMPGLLRELYGALRNDPFLVAECIARPALVDRFVRSFVSSDSRLQSRARAEAEMLRESLEANGLGRLAKDSRRTEVSIQRSSFELNSRTKESVLLLPPDAFDRVRRLLPSRVATIGPIEEGKTSFVIRVIEEESDGFVRVSSFVVNKVTWDLWWGSHSKTYDGRLLCAIGSGKTDLPALNLSTSETPFQDGNALSLLDDQWDNASLASVPAGRPEGHSAIWTGTQMVIWGGGDFLNTGSRYDPATDTWTAISTLGAPAGRTAHTAVWTGAEMIVWGGEGPTGIRFDSGGRYDPVADVWRTMFTSGAPSARSHHSAVWAGAHMIVWGGRDASSDQFTGGVYDPSTDAWNPTSTLDSADARSRHTAVWTGTEMIVWGGVVLVGNIDYNLSTGGRYNPASDTWSPVSSAFPPEPRHLHSAVWTGNRMVVWGGDGGLTGGHPLKSGGQYDPGTDSWRRVSTQGAPSARSAHTAVWTGIRMIVWGGTQRSGQLGNGGAYDPLTNRWEAISTLNAPQHRYSHTAVWTGDLMIVWGGSASDQTGTANTGGRYDPATDSWTATSTGSGPSPRSIHTALWTGTEMVIWGGFDDEFTMRQLSSGGRYDPATDTWKGISTVRSPARRERHSAVWTGNRMVVWGGWNDQAGSLSTGGRYDPIGDTWTTVSTVLAPSARYEHAAIWTGTEVVVWGGTDSVVDLDSGGRYDPVVDVWRPTSTSNAPIARRAHTAVWTGNKMIVWGGTADAAGFFLNTGGLYDPTNDAWTSVTIAGAPDPRWLHTAVWTGTTMAVWGGSNDALLSTGALYDPTTDTWSSMSTTNAPEARAFHTAVWTGSRVIIWGGLASTHALQTGARYDPGVDTWSSTSLVNAAEPRWWHTAVWTGEMMIVWGGVDAASTGGRYLVAP